MSKPNRYRTDNDEREEEARKGHHHGLALLILVLLAGVVGWFWLARDPESRDAFSRRVSELEQSAITLMSDL